MLFVIYCFPSMIILNDANSFRRAVCGLRVWFTNKNLEIKKTKIKNSGRTPFLYKNSESPLCTVTKMDIYLSMDYIYQNYSDNKKYRQNKRPLYDVFIDSFCILQTK